MICGFAGTVNRGTPLPWLWTPRHEDGANRRCAGALVAYIENVDSTPDDKEETMFTELTEELLDLEATTKGYVGALYAAVDPGGSCCGGCCNLVLCCCCSQICW